MEIKVPFSDFTSTPLENFSTTPEFKGGNWAVGLGPELK